MLAHLLSTHLLTSLKQHQKKFGCVIVHAAIVESAELLVLAFCGHLRPLTANRRQKLLLF